MITERDILEQLRNGEITLPPLSFRLLTEQLVIADGRFDALVEATWQEERVQFIAEIKANFTPKAFRNGLNFLKLSSLPEDKKPMLIMPFLDNEKLMILEQEGISGIDLCGNGVVIVPGTFAVFRTGEKKRFTTSAPIKNIYRKNSSMVGRVFFLSTRFETVQEILLEINRRNLLVKKWDKKPMSLSTVSKSLKTLTDDLIIDRADGIRLIQPDKLLEKLALNYLPPNITRRIKLKIPASENIQELLQQLSQEVNVPLMATGTSSVSRYAVMERGGTLEIYCPGLEDLLPYLPADKSDRFPNLELIETTSERVYFDARQIENFWWASPIQVYLELLTGDKRDQETALQVKSGLLQNIKREQQ